MKSFIAASLALLSLAAAAAPECSGEMMVPSYNCSNVHPGVDVRLYIMEFQTCENDKIVDFDRNESMMNFSLGLDQVEGSDVEIQYQEQRSFHDRANRVDNLTFIKPVAARAVFGDEVVEMTFSNRLKPLYDGDSQGHMPGKFKITKAGKVVKSGSLSCFIDN